MGNIFVPATGAGAGKTRDVFLHFSYICLDKKKTFHLPSKHVSDVNVDNIFG